MIASNPTDLIGPKFSDRAAASAKRPDGGPAQIAGVLVIGNDFQALGVA